MAPNTRSSGGNVCVDDSRTAFDAAAFDVAANSALRASPAASAGPPTQHKHDDVVIFFDWDDTLMASSAIAKLGLCPKFVHEKPAIPADVALELAALEVAVVELLDLALVRGRVVIVTAAETGWVELSAALFMPRVVPLLNTHIKVVSARSTYEYLYPDCPRRWKIEAFNHEVFPAWELYSDESDGIDPTTLPRHVISLGDGPTEREALINVKMQALDACFGKSMKFITYPKIHELRLEVELIVANFEYLVAHDGDLDLQITWEMLNNANTNTNSSSNNNASGA